ncbi:hypothetical protein [Amycolatopsis dongchuanensis]|uniref:Uncharacterized protein n=1 Tax=Amycolatopsis dongchuanensis TaxID=1070866 RepID=A0ABP8VDS1_9PSEU
MNLWDPTARAAIQHGDQDVLGLALAKLKKTEAELVVLRYGFSVPVAVLVRMYRGPTGGIPDYDYLGHVHGLLAGAVDGLAEYLREGDLAPEDLDWQSSAAVRNIGARFRVDQLLPCAHCRQRKISVINPRGRPREYCSAACKQAAYRERRSNPSAVAAASNDPEHGRIPCFAGMERRIPVDVRFNLIELQQRGAISIDRLTLQDDPSLEACVDDLCWRRWSPGSPLRRAARAALSHLVRRGVTPDQVWLHGSAWPDGTSHSIGLECRYIRDMPWYFNERGGTEWLEIPRPSRNAPLLALHIRPTDPTTF